MPERVRNPPLQKQMVLPGFSFLLNQHPPQYLSGGVLRDGVRELDLSYLFEGCHLAGDDLHYLFGRRRLAFSDDYKGFRNFPRLLILDADHRRVGDGWVGQQQTLEFSGWHLETFVFDQFFLAVQYPDIAVFIGANDIPGV